MPVHKKENTPRDDKEGSVGSASLCRGGQSRLVEPGSQAMRTRGATQVDLLVTDGHDGRLAAVSELFSATPRQRWQVA